MVNCNFTYYNFTVQYQDGGFSIIDEVIVDRFLSDGFSGPMRATAPSKAFMEELESTFLTSGMTDGERMELLSDYLTQLALASASIFANTTGPALSQQ